MQARWIVAVTVLGIAMMPVCADSVLTEPIGFNKVVCLANSDTIVGVPLRHQGGIATRLAALPVVDGDSATLVLNHDGFTPGALNTHYLKFNGGSREGRWYDITSNNETSLTLDLNGDTLAGVVADEKVLIVEYWTLDSLFPPDQATTSWAEDPENPGMFIPDGHAIVASNSTLPAGRRSELRVPDLQFSGVNRPYESRYYIHGGIWKRNGAGNDDSGHVVLYPDVYVAISHPAAVPHHTVFRSVGEVEMTSHVIALATSSNGRQDNNVAIPRPVGTTLNQLNLLQSGTFVPSTSTLPGGRRDQLLVFDNDLQLRNKSVSATYFVHEEIWKRAGGGNDDFGDEELPAGSGFIIRKHQTAHGETVFWTNTPGY